MEIISDPLRENRRKKVKWNKCEKCNENEGERVEEEAKAIKIVLKQNFMHFNVPLFPVRCALLKNYKSKHGNFPL